MSQSQTNLMALAAAVRHDKKQLSAVSKLAQKLKMPSPQRQQKQPSAQATRLQNFVRKIKPQDLQSAISKFGRSAVFNRANTDSIREVFAQKAAAHAIRKAGR